VFTTILIMVRISYVDCLNFIKVKCKTNSVTVGDPRDYKWINTIQLQKTLEQVCFPAILLRLEILTEVDATCKG